MASLLSKMKNERVLRVQDKTIDEYSITLKKAELVAAAELVCEQLKNPVKMNIDTDISLDEIRKYKDEFTHI